MPKHEPLYYATYKGPQAIARVDERGYPAGQQVQIGKADADAIRRQKDHAFDLDAVPKDLIGTAEDAHPTDPGAAQAHNERLAALGG